MKRKPRLGRLLDRQVVSNLLTGYTSLLGQTVSLGLIDARGRSLGANMDLDQAKRDRLWDQVCNEGAFIAPTRDLSAWPITFAGETVGMLLALGQLPANLETVVPLLILTLETLASEADAKRAIAQETLDRYREINVLYNIGETLGACLELDQVCRLVLDESVKLIDCCRGAVLLAEQAEKTSGAHNLSLTAATGMDNLSNRTIWQYLSLTRNIVRSGRPQIVNEFQPEGLSRMPVVCAPLRFQDKVLGAILLSEKTNGTDFTAADEKLLVALATQAASSIENARLFENVKQQRDEIATMKNYMDNIFASIASGVITTDMENNITTFNRAAETILSLPSRTVLNRPRQQALAFFNNTPLPTLISEVQRKGETYIGFEISTHLPPRGQVHLNMSLSRLRGSSQEPLGVTIVIDDVTERKRFERERRIVRRYLPPELVDSLPDDLDEIKLRGERQMITTLFADIRGFTSFSEAQSPETVVEVINHYFALADEAVRKYNGIIDKYLGDAVMAVFNTPLLEIEDHAWVAAQAAWELKQSITLYHEEVEPELRMNFGMGICTGEAVVGNVGALERMEYTAIGDAVNVAKRLQENAAAGQIVISSSTWERIRDRIYASQLPSITLKGRRTTTEVFRLDGLVKD